VDDKLATSLTTAFLLLLERLTPKERAAYLLYEIFDQPYAEIAAMLEMDEAACRKLVSRARQNVDHDKVRHVTPKETQDDLLRAFQSAVMSGSTHQLAALLGSRLWELEVGNWELIRYLRRRAPREAADCRARLRLRA
jgi:RNA polymerase sigma-70 factor (ECF subfamily)